MLTPGFSLFLALFRIAAGISLLTSGLQKLSWLSDPPLEQRLDGLIARGIRKAKPLE